jgi:hypothetical protein
MEEALMRVDSTHYMSHTLTNFYYDRNKNSEFLINYEQKTSGFSLNTENRIATLTNEVKYEQIPVVLRNPMSAKEIINGDKGLFKKVIDAQEEDFPKDYIDVEMNFTDFPVYTEIQTQGLNVITILKRNLLDAIPADFLIMPVLNHTPHPVREVEAGFILYKKFKLIIQDCVLDEELPDASYSLTPYLMRETPVPNRLSVNKINATNVIKEITLGNFYTLQLTSTQEPVVEEAPAPVAVIIPSPPINYQTQYVRPFYWIEAGVERMAGFKLFGGWQSYQSGTGGYFITREEYDLQNNPQLWVTLWDEPIKEVAY